MMISNSFSQFIDSLFTYTYLQQALIASILVGIICGVIGCFIILRGMALMGDAISHAVLPGVAISYMLGVGFFWGAVVTGVLTALGIGYISQNTKIKEDSAIGIMFTAAFALGIVLINLMRGVSVDLYHILFGNVLGVSDQDLVIVAVIGFIVLAVIALFYKELLISTFDPTMSKAIGLPTNLIHYSLMLLLSLVTVASLKTVGIVLVVAMLITPGATAYLLTDRLHHMLWISSLVGILSSVSGLFLSYTFDVSSGAAIVLVATFLFLCAMLFSPKQGIVIKAIKTGHRRKEVFLGCLIGILLISGFGAFANSSLHSISPTDGKEKPLVVSSFSVIHDIVQNIGGDRVRAEYLTPIGEDPHEFEPTPSTFKLIADAEIIFYNGYNLDYWIRGLAQNSETKAREVILTEGVPPIPLSEEAGELANKEDPHTWLSPKNIKIYAKNIANALIELDPEGTSIYQKNLDQYLGELEQLEQWIEEEVSQIPIDKRVIVTSESAFKYFAKDYGFEYDSIWEINAHEEGSPKQIERLVKVIKEKQLPAVYLETSVDPRPMERVASEAGIVIAGEVFTDSIGKEGSGAETYIKMMKKNVSTFVEGLKK